jgi:hypothetical protein
MNMRFGTCHVKSQYRSGSLKTVARELSKYVRWVGQVTSMGDTRNA